MTAVGGVLWLGMLLGMGAALSVGPIFVVIVQQAATSGFAASFRVILIIMTFAMFIGAMTFMYVSARAVTDRDYRAQFIDPVTDDPQPALPATVRMLGAGSMDLVLARLPETARLARGKAIEKILRS